MSTFLHGQASSRLPLALQHSVNTKKHCKKSISENGQLKVFGLVYLRTGIYFCKLQRCRAVKDLRVNKSHQSHQCHREKNKTIQESTLVHLDNLLFVYNLSRPFYFVSLKAFKTHFIIPITCVSTIGSWSGQPTYDFFLIMWLKSLRLLQSDQRYGFQLFLLCINRLLPYALKYKLTFWPQLEKNCEFRSKTFYQSQLKVRVCTGIF